MDIIIEFVMCRVCDMWKSNQWKTMQSDEKLLLSINMLCAMRRSCYVERNANTPSEASSAKDKVYYLSETLNEEMEEMENFFPSSSSFCSFLSTLFSQLVAFPTLAAAHWTPSPRQTSSQPYHTHLSSLLFITESKNENNNRQAKQWTNF